MDETKYLFLRTLTLVSETSFSVLYGEFFSKRSSREAGSLPGAVCATYELGDLEQYAHANKEQKRLAKVYQNICKIAEKIF